MKRSLFVLIVLIVLIASAPAAFAFDPVKRDLNRITVLEPPLYGSTDVEMQIAGNVRRHLASELRSRGFDVVQSPATYADLQRSGATDAGLFVEIAPSDFDSSAQGDVAIAGRNAGVDLALLVSRVAAELRVYDGRTLALIAKRHLTRKDVSVVPTAIGAGGYRMSVWFALPFVRYARYRVTAGAIVNDAVAEIGKIAGR